MPFWGRYIPVAERRAKAKKQMEKLRKQGKDIQPVTITGRVIARSVWGQRWCDHLESFSDFANRLPRGRAYVRNGSVCHLQVQAGRIEAIVSGSSLYKVSIEIKKLSPGTWKAIKKTCFGQIGSMLELLQGKLSGQVMGMISDRKKGLFPQPEEISLHCNCPDWATMCKHVAAVLYGVGSRLDHHPEMLFLLRDVDPENLISDAIILPTAVTETAKNVLADEQLGEIFDIDLATEDGLGNHLEQKEIKPVSKKRIIRKAIAANQTRRKKTVSTTKKVRKGIARKIAIPKNETAYKKNQITKPKILAKKVRQTAPLPKIRPTGKSVIRLRKQLKMSIFQFAKRLDVSVASIYRWEGTEGRLALRTRPLHALAVLQQKSKNA